MVLNRLPLAAALLAAAIGTSACVYDDGYGYGGVNVGYGAGYGGGYYDPYDDYGYGYDGYGYAGYGGGFGSPYWGWYGDFYYPGTGIYVYDRYRRPYRWNDYQRRYWSDRRDHWRGRDGDGVRDNWRDFPRGQGGRRGNWQGAGWQGNRGNDDAAGTTTQQGTRGNWQGYRGNGANGGNGATQQGWQNRGQWRQQGSAAGQGTVRAAPQYRSGGGASRGGPRRGH